jgi:hypothetical protein
MIPRLFLGFPFYYTPRHSDAEIENFGHLHLEYRYVYHFVAHDRLSRKNVLGGLKGVKSS